MNKKIVIVLSLGVLGTLIIVGVTRFLPVINKKNPACTPMEQAQAAPTAEVTNITDIQQLNKALEGKRPAVIKFYADWCGACSYVNGYYGQMSQELPEVDFYSVNIDNQALMKEIDDMQLSKEGIEYLPTFIMVQPGKVHEQMTGAKKKEEMIKTIKEIFNI